jgi:hypothetical protein
MTDTNASNSFPKVQIKPYDGMSITANVWSQAHEEHRQTGRAHNLALHGSGIVTGLEVVANDPSDKYVFISPGVAIDTGGNVIELTEPVAYDFGASAEGKLYLLLGHGEREIGGIQKDIKYIQNEFVIAARSSVPKRPSVELARVTISDPGKPIRNADNHLHPGSEELDLRFRNSIDPGIKRPLSVAIGMLGKENPEVTRGWDYLSRELEHSTGYRLIIDHSIPISSELLDFELVYLGWVGSFRVIKRTVSILNQYLDYGKCLIIEALDEAAQKSCNELLEKLNRKLQPVEENNKILTAPFLFYAPPDGFNGNHILLDDQVIFSTAGYSQAWAGKTGGDSLSRAEIRATHEWGVNMILHLMKEAKA